MKRLDVLKIITIVQKQSDHHSFVDFWHRLEMHINHRVIGFTAALRSLSLSLPPRKESWNRSFLQMAITIRATPRNFVDDQDEGWVLHKNRWWSSIYRSLATFWLNIRLGRLMPKLGFVTSRNFSLWACLAERVSNGVKLSRAPTQMKTYWLSLVNRELVAFVSSLSSSPPTLKAWIHYSW